MHDLALLLSHLEESGETLNEQVLRAGRLTSYASATRYLGSGEPVSEREYQAAVKIAETVVRWAEQRLRFEGSA